MVQIVGCCVCTSTGTGTCLKSTRRVSPVGVPRLSPRHPATPPATKASIQDHNKKPTPLLDRAIMLCTATSITSNIDGAWRDDEHRSAYLDQIAMNTVVNNNSNNSEDSICRLCNHGASDIRVLGCGCTLHSVSWRAAFPHCFVWMTKKYPAFFSP